MPLIAIPALALALGAAAPMAVAAEPALDSHKARYSYLVGVRVGQSFERDGLDIDPEVFAGAVADVLAGRDLRLGEAELAAVAEERRHRVSQRRRQLLAEKAAAEEAFLAEHGQREDVTVRPSGLQYRVLEAGTGPRPAPGSRVTVHYRGRLLDGTEFDSSRERGTPATLDLANVIPGWREALPLMRQGARWRVVVPAALGYGEDGVGGVIGPNETLLFDIELLEVATPAAGEASGQGASAGGGA